MLFVAWDDDASAAWLDVGRADARPGDVERWSSALGFARDHGYVYSTHAVPDEELGRTVGRALDPDSGTTRSARGELIDLLGHGSYLGSGTEADEPLRLVQVSAPVFGPDGDVAATIMVLGSVRPIPAEEVRALTRRVVDAANTATMQARDLALRQPFPG